jgi:two-component system NtrC family sensor kinase
VAGGSVPLLRYRPYALQNHQEVADWWKMRRLEALRPFPVPREAAESVSAALDGLGEAFFAFDHTGALARMNLAAERLCGQPLAEAFGKPAAEVVPLRAAGSNEVVQLPLASLLSEAGPLAPGVDLLLARADGAMLAVTGGGAPLREDGAATGVLLVLRDVTAERAAFAHARTLHLELFDLFDGFADGIAVYRGDTMVYVNRSLSEIAGLPREAMLGRRLDEFLVIEAEEPLRTASDGSPAPKTASDLFRVRRDDQVRLVELGRAQAIEYEGDLGSMLLLRDVTEREKLRSELHEKSRMASVGTLAAGLTHEINNPLTYVLANANFALDQVKGGRLSGPQLPELRLALEELCEGAERASGIVADLSGFVRGDGLESVPVDLRPVLETALRMTRHQVKGRAQLVSSLGEVPLVSGSRARLGQLVVHLLVNAAQSIELGDEANNHIEVELDTDARGWARLRIRDTGSGMSPEVRSRIFEPFFTTRPVGQGAGLGLSVSHNIVSGMGGHITVQSEVGQGSRFTVSLPPAEG